MIITVTMNPALDRTQYVDWLHPGDLNRIGHTQIDAGGKGINVSKMLKVIGGDSIAAAIVGGNSGKLFEEYLAPFHLHTDFMQISGETRTNSKIIESSGRMTELNEPGPILTKTDVKKFTEKLLALASPDALFVISGSVPRGVDTYCYKHMIEALHAQGAKVLLDADGALLRMGMEAKPDILKPNRKELQALFGLGTNHDLQEDELISLAYRLQAAGADTFAISLGKDGALFSFGKMLIRSPGLSVNTNSTVGAGDAMVAALAYGHEIHLPPEETARLCMAASAAAAASPGTQVPDKSLISELSREVELLTF